MLRTSLLCLADSWSSLDICDLANLYDFILKEIFDILYPCKQARRSCRRSDPWFDQECRHTKRALIVWKSIVALVILCLYTWQIPGENNYEITAVFSDGNG